MKNSKLRGRIIERYGTIGAFAEAFGETRQNVSLKLNGKGGWPQEKIDKAAALLGIPKREIGAYFFTR